MKSGLVFIADLDCIKIKVISSILVSGVVIIKDLHRSASSAQIKMVLEAAINHDEK